jgi:large subunit ribosomal protein L1
MDLVINQDLKFDKVLATPEMIDELKKHGRFLGSKGLMPNPKLGTVVDFDNLGKAIKEAKLGSVTFRIEHNGAMIHAPIGRASFTPEMILMNLTAFTKGLLELKPASVKGKYFRTCYMSSTHGPSWKLDPKTLYELDG